ncbi:MAG: 4-hydroxyphenylpyruvate dioxygenase [Flavobacteriales bacterium]|nr:MAG: 4-hydroxyphenylpyruvate dioxygenase [Rhodocyclaceae bacterium]MBE2266522.1 4-hydroxyphenylpyruvate dioxygenase [Flavobacteriales bacterium]MBW7853753.1 4-hydroxyphenylpyruvate dioxygenase [Candidatus Kapabacteria bacterium]MCC6331622.1 4-hydroxyphenylpyruvate dioxygenase [Ignavibacteria bacterium]MBZ0194176.1 4-hydroxyphenylpyruvate dioxygenase [Candidatus Kapabacteria bacterium]
MTDQEFLPINGTDFIEFYVGNAKQTTYFYRTAFGFKLIAYAGPETGVRDRASYVLQQGKIRLIITTPMHPDHPVSDHIKLHGDGVKILALWVDDAKKAWEETTRRGAKSAMEPTILKDEHGEVVVAGIHTYGETVHTFVERKNYSGVFMPGYSPVSDDYVTEPVGLLYVDHCVGNVELGKMNEWVAFYEDVMGFKLLKTFDDNDISTEYTALMSKVMTNGNGYIKFPINEPAKGKKKSQIDEYLEFYHGPGVQHIAVATNDIIHTVGELRRRGVEFLTVPDTYYEDLLDRVGSIEEDLADIRRLNILVDRDDEGYLLQIFTKPVGDRPTLFYEVIQRKGARSFGKGNFKALFESIEREQERRGNL